MVTSSNQSSVFWTLSHCWKKNKRAGALMVYSQHVKYCMIRCIMKSVGGVTVCEAQKPANINMKHLWTDTPFRAMSLLSEEACRCVQMCSLYLLFFHLLSWHLQFFPPQLFWDPSLISLDAAWKQIQRGGTTCSREKNKIFAQKVGIKYKNMHVL